MTTIKKYRQRDGLTKHCECKKWSACDHPWQAAFYLKTCGCPTPICPPEVRKAHAKLNRVRVSLHKFANKPRSYEMSKTEAEGWMDKLRDQVRSGTFDKPEAPRPTDARLTFGDVATLYFDKHVNVPTRRKGPIAATANYLRIIRRAAVPASNGSTVSFESKPIVDVTKADVEAVREFRRAELREIASKRERAIAEGRKTGRVVLPGTRGGEVGVEHMMAMLRHLFGWAVKEGHIDASPFRKNGLTVIDVRVSKKSSRKRRLDREANERERLLAAAVPEGEYGLGGRAPEMATHLRDLIVAAVESGCRRGELLSLQWHQIKTKNGAPYRIHLPADKTKTSEPRDVPITARLRALLEFRRIGPDAAIAG
jgi:integrase